MIFEFLAGLFGWIWIGAGIATLVFAGLALFGDYSWWNVLYAVIVSGVAKWLARGFLDNQRRVAFEADMTSGGMSSKEAGDAWLRMYLDTDGLTGEEAQPTKTPDAVDVHRKAEERINIISDYGALMEERSSSVGSIWDVRSLPHDKKAILGAICFEIIGEDDDQKVEMLKIGALSLADYQEGVGGQPISPLGVDLSKVDSNNMTDDAIRDLAAKIADNPDQERYKKYKPLVAEDISKIQSMLNKAEALRKEVSEKKKREVLG